MTKITDGCSPFSSFSSPEEMFVTTKRTPAQRVAIGIAVLVTLAFIGAGAVSAASGIVTQSKDASRTITGAVTTVHVTVDGSVQVQPGPDGQVTVATHEVWSFSQPTVSETQSGTDLTITASCSAPQFGTCATSVRLVVPSGAALIVTSQAANISVSGVQGALTLHSGDGDVHVASASGPLQLSSANGDVTGTGLSSSQVQASSNNGTVDLTFTGVPQTVTGSSDNGSVIVGLPRGPTTYLVSATSDNGSHSVGVPTNSTSDRHIVVSSSNGNVSVDYAP
jgi:Putative adhesin